MITSVDTSVLLDVFGADETFLVRSRDALRRAIREGSLVACDVVWAEVAGLFPRRAPAVEAMNRVGIAFDPLDHDSALTAGTAWRAYRQRGGRRTRVIADFLIGAHAMRRADRLLTRDRGFYRKYFHKLAILDPGAEAEPR